MTPTTAPAGNTSKVDAQTRKFAIEGPTVRLVSPGADGQIDIGALWGRGFIDVVFTVNVPGYQLDLASVTDLAAEFTLSGAGLGTVKLDAGQAPVFLSQTGNDFKFRYWTTGEFAAAGGSAEPAGSQVASSTT